MYKEYDINLIYKLIGLLLFLLTISFISNIYILILLFLGLFIFNRKNNPLLFLMIMLTMLFLVLKIVDNSILIVNVILILDYITVFLINIKKDDFVLAKNMFFNKKYTYSELSKNYINGISSDNEVVFSNFVDSHSLEMNEELLEIKERLVSKNNDELFDKLTINYFRFYKNQNDGYKYLGFNRETLIYLGCHLIIFILAVVI